MTFSNTKYEADNGDIMPLRIAPETLAAAGTVPTGAVTNSIRPKISKSANEYGIRPRRVTGSRRVGTAPDQFLRYVTVPVLQVADFALATFAMGATITVDGLDYEIISKRGEDIN